MLGINFGFLQTGMKHGIAIGVGTVLCAFILQSASFDMNNFWLGFLPSIVVPFSLGYGIGKLTDAFK